MYLYLSLISIFICLTSANDLNDHNLDDFNQSLNNFDTSSNNSTSNLIDLLQSIQLNSTEFISKNNSELNSTSNIPILFNTYQYDSPVYQELKNKEPQSESSNSQLESSGSSQNFFSKEYSNFDDNQKLFIEQQIEQDSKYLPDIYDPIQPQQIEQTNLADNQIVYGTKNTNTNKPIIQSTYKTPASINRYKQQSTKNSINSIKMANNQEWNIIDKNNRPGYIQIEQPKSNNYFSNNYKFSNENAFNNLDQQQIDLAKITKIKNQPQNYKSVEGVQIISQYVPTVQQQKTLSTNYQQQTKQPAAQYNLPTINYQQPNYSRKPCSKNQQIMNYETTRQRPFYFGWKQRQQPQQQKLYSNYQQSTNYAQQSYPNYQFNNNYQSNKQHFGMPIDESINQMRKCCIIKIIPKQQPSMVSSSNRMPYFNQFLQSGQVTGNMFGFGVNGFLNKLENKKSKIKNLIKAPFIIADDLKHKALGKNSNQNYYPNYQQSYRQNYQQNYQQNAYQPQNTFSMPYNQVYPTKSYN